MGIKHTVNEVLTLYRCSSRVCACLAYINDGHTHYLHFFNNENFTNYGIAKLMHWEYTGLGTNMEFLQTSSIATCSWRRPMQYKETFSGTKAIWSPSCSVYCNFKSLCVKIFASELFELKVCKMYVQLSHIQLLITWFGIFCVFNFHSVRWVNKFLTTKIHKLQYCVINVLRMHWLGSGTNMEFLQVCSLMASWDHTSACKIHHLHLTLVTSTLRR